MKFTAQNAIMQGAQQIPWPSARDQSVEIRYVTLHLSGAVPPCPVPGDPQTAQEQTKYHLNILRDGTVVQAVPLDRRSGHAGPSNWKGLNSLNHHSIGVALQTLPLENRGGPDLRDVTPEQYTTLRHVVGALVRAYPSLRDIVPYYDICSGLDTAPTRRFDLAAARRLIPRHAADFGPVYLVNTAYGDNLFVRKGPSSKWGVCDSLPSGTKVHLRTRAYRTVCGKLRQSRWASIARLNSHEPIGYVYTGYLVPTEPPAPT